MSNVRLDDLWLASFLLAEGARCKQVAVVPYSNGRLQAFFELEEIPPGALEAYAAGDPKVSVHAFREALHTLRAAMHEAVHEALAKRNGNNNHQKTNPPETINRSVKNNEQNTSGDHRSDQGDNRSGRLHPSVRQTR
jgi:hypothetical protein